MKAMAGIQRFAKQEDFDIFTFLSFASYSEHVSLMRGELNIYELCEPREYDGVIVFSTMLNSTETAVATCRKAKEQGAAVVSVGMEIEGIASVSVSNEEGMAGLVTHLIEEHGIKRPFFIGGTPDHVDSNARLQITKEIFERYGMPLAEDQIGYGKWSNRYTIEVLQELLASGREMPDAFICANDVMAMALCTELEKLGKDVPKDILVTGFDELGEGVYFYPSLTTVKQNYETVGYDACSMIYEQLRTQETGSVIRKVVPSSLVIGESCGCKGEKDYNAIHNLYCKHSFQRNTEAKLLEQNERNLRRVISGVSDYPSLKKGLQSFYTRNHQFEGLNFAIVLNKEYFEDVMASEKELWERGFEHGLEVVVSLKQGMAMDEELTDRRQLVPGYRKEKGVQHVYFFCPLHYYEYNYGYAMFEDDPYITKENMLYPYLEKLQQSLKLLRTNLRLQLLYDKDPMTGLYNRFGYENKALPLYQESLRNDSAMMVMFVDINRMKWINDKYGHLHGDNAIRIVASAIRENIEETWIAIRFGGDEFLIIAPNCDGAGAERVKESILEALEQKNKSSGSPYQITVSCGYVLTDPKAGQSMSMQDYIKEADRLMYEIKQELHAREGKD